MPKFAEEDLVTLKDNLDFADPQRGRPITIPAGTQGRVRTVKMIASSPHEFVEYTVDFDGFSPPPRLVDEDDLM